MGLFSHDKQEVYERDPPGTKYGIAGGPRTSAAQTARSDWTSIPTDYVIDKQTRARSRGCDANVLNMVHNFAPPPPGGNCREKRKKTHQLYIEKQ